MSFKNSFIVSLVFVLGVVFLVLSVPQDSRAGFVPVESDCCVEHGTPGCDNSICEDFICTIDPFCCNVEWDGKCVSQAEESCAVCGGEPSELIRPIPTLNQWGLIALAGIMGLAALYILIRRRPFESS